MTSTRDCQTIFVALVVLLTLTYTAPVSASFFEGKTMRILVGFSPGGGYDAYARLLARYMKKYLPDEPDIIVQNMPGSGGRRAANYLYQAARPDGLTLAHLAREAYLSQLTGEPGVQFDVTKFIVIGSITSENRLAFLNTDVAPYRNVGELREALAAGKEIYIGGTGVGSTSHTIWKTIEAVVPEVEVKYVLGYPGMAEAHLAMRKGELAGAGQSKTGLRLHGKWLTDSGKIALLAQIGTPDRQRDPDFPDTPTLWEFADTKEEKAIVSVSAAASVGGRPFFLPPGTPPERVKIIREAFMKAVTDPEFRAEARRTKLSVDPVKGEVVEELYADIFAMPDADKRTIVKLLREQ